MAAEKGHSDDSLAGAKIRDALADLFDRARDFHAGNEWRPWRSRIGARAHEEIGEVQADRGHLDEDFSPAGDRIGPIAQAETVGTAVAVYEPGARHRRHQPV